MIISTLPHLATVKFHCFGKKLWIQRSVLKNTFFSKSKILFTNYLHEQYIFELLPPFAQDATTRTQNRWRLTAHMWSKREITICCFSPLDGYDTNLWHFTSHVFPQFRHSTQETISFGRIGPCHYSEPWQIGRLRGIAWVSYKMQEKGSPPGTSHYEYAPR